MKKRGWQKMARCTVAGGLLVWLCLAATGGTAVCAAEKPQAMSLAQAINMALEYSPKLTEAREDLIKARFAKKESFTSFLPTLDTGYTWNHVDEVTEYQFGPVSVQLGTEDTFQWSLSASQPVFTGFRLQSLYRLAGLGVDLAQIQIDLARLDVVLAVKEAYLEYLRAQKNLEVARQSVQLLSAQLKTTEDFHEVGIIPINDVLKVKVDLSDAQQKEVAAQNRVSVTRAQLNTLLGRDVNAGLEVEDILRERKVDITFERAREQARMLRPELKALNIQLHQADLNIKQAQSGYYPQVNLKGEYLSESDSPELSESEYHDQHAWQVTAVLQWNLWSWGRTDHQVSGQRAARRRLDATRRDLEDQVDLQVKETYLFMRDAEKTISTARASIDFAKENFRITRERFKEQLTTNTEVLDAQTQLTRAMTNFTDAVTVFNLGEARLYRAMGLEKIPGSKKP
jgi:outer membrane protein TolC